MAWVGARATYGFTRHFSIEAELMGARTGSDARFDNVSFNDVDGDLVRSVSLGRLQAGVVGRIGHRLVPTLRLGIAGQGTSHDAELITPSGVMPGPDSSLKFTMFIAAGLGIDVHVGSSLLLGAGLSGLTLLGGGESDLFRRGLQIGVHLGYAWKP